MPQKVDEEGMKKQFEEIAAMSILSGAMKIRQIHEKLMSHHHPAFE
jgi:hypothetical protein